MIFYRVVTKILFITLILVLLCWSFNGPVCSKEISEEKIHEWIEQLNDEDWRHRSIAVSYLDQLKESQKTEKVKIALINLLNKELIIEEDGKEHIRTAIRGQGKEEGFSEYIGQLLDAVANLKDARTIPIFVEYITWGRKVLPEIGEPAVEPLIEKLDKSLDSVVVFILGEMLKPKDEGYVAKDKTREKIKQALIRTLKLSEHPTDKSIECYEFRVRQMAIVRKSVVTALGNLGDKDIIPYIKEIAEEDPYFKENEKIYPVREEARKVLKQFEMKN